MSLKLSAQEIPQYMRERYEALRDGDKYRWRAFLRKYYGERENPHRIEDIERAMHIIRANEQSLPKREREKSANWLRLYNKYLT